MSIIPSPNPIDVIHRARSLLQLSHNHIFSLLSPPSVFVHVPLATLIHSCTWTGTPLEHCPLI